MFKSTPTILAICLVAFVAACAGAKTDEVVYVDEPVVSTEPVFTGKYGS